MFKRKWGFSVGGLSEEVVFDGWVSVMVEVWICGGVEGRGGGDDLN